MIEDFSSGYYRIEMNVQEYDPGPVIQRDLYKFINRELYLNSNMPVTMRVGLDAGETFRVGTENAIPKDTLALPGEMMESSGEKDVFILKSQYLDSVGEYNG